MSPFPNPLARPSRPRRGPHLLGATIIVVAAALLGAVGAALPALAVVFCAGVLTLGIFAAAYRWPERMLPVLPLIVLLAGTQYRHRPATASLGGEADARIYLELALYGLVGVATLIAAVHRRERLRGWGLMDALAGFYVVVAIASTLWSDAPLLTAVRSAQLATLFVVAAVSVRVLGVRAFLLSLGACVTVYVLAFAGMAVALPGAASGAMAWRTQRFAWFNVHPIECATYAAVALLLSVAVALRGTSPGARRRRGLVALWWAGALASLVILLLTRSRGPLLAVVAALAVLLVLRFVRPTVAPLLAAGLFVLMAIYANVGKPVDRLLVSGAESENAAIAYLYRGQDAEQLMGFSGRHELWAGVSSLVSERPILGYGYQGSRAHLLALMPWAATAHDALAQSLLDLGLLGTLPLAAAIALALVSGVWRRGSHPADADLSAVLVAALTFLLFNGITAETFVGTPGYSALLMLAAVISVWRLRAERTSLRARAPLPGVPRGVPVSALAGES